MRRRALAIVSLALVAGCSERAPAAHGQDVGAGAAPRARTVTELSRAVVGLHHGGLDMSCTGSLVRGDVVLTARHCVAKLRGEGCSGTFEEPAAPGGLRVTAEPNLFSPGGVHAVAVEVPAGNRACADDVALVRLASPLAKGEAALAIASDPHPAPALPYAAVGYGATRAKAIGLGSRRVHEGGVVLESPADVGETEWLGSLSACAGDSGGPALDAQGRIVGVLSRSLHGEPCRDPVYASLGAHAGWLSVILARWSPSP